MNVASSVVTLVTLALAACGSPTGTSSPAAPYLGRWTTDEVRAADEVEAWVRARKGVPADDAARADLAAAVVRARQDVVTRREHLELRPDGTATLTWQGGSNPALDRVGGTWVEKDGVITIAPTTRDGRAIEPGEHPAIVLAWDRTRLTLDSKRDLKRSLRRYRTDESPPPAADGSPSSR